MELLGNGWMKKDSAKDWSVSKRFKGTVAYTKERNVWCLRVTDSETNQLKNASDRNVCSQHRHRHYDALKTWRENGRKGMSKPTSKEMREN